MRAAKILLPTVALLALTGCAAGSPSDASAKCGGESAGITIDADGVLKYDQSQDTTAKAWTCLLNELVPDKDDQYTITQGMDGGDARDGEFNGYTVVYAMNPTRGVQLYFNP